MIFKMTAERYAKALYETAVAMNELDQVKKDIQQILYIFSVLPDVKKYCINKDVSVQNAMKVIESAFLEFMQSTISANTLEAMAENARISSLPFLPDAFFAICAEKDNRITVSAEFANPPEPKIIEQIKQKLSEKTGMTIELSTKITPAILGGFRLKWHNRIIDNSAQGRLKQLKRVLT